MDSMRPALLLAMASLLVGIPAFADPPAPPSAFVDTDPIGARFTVDGELSPAVTPVLLRGLKAGPHRIVLWKDGATTTVKDFTVPAEGVATVEVTLTPAATRLAFPQADTVVDAQGATDAEGRQFQMPTGSYTLTVQEGAVHIRPVFPDQGLLDAAGWGLGVLSIGFLGSAGSDLWHGFTGWSNHPTMITASLLAAALLDLPWYLALQGRKDRFDKESATRSTVLPEFPRRAGPLLADAEAALQAGSLTEAEQLLTRITAEAPESREVGQAWYQLARLHTVTGRRALAIGEYRLVAEVYPLPSTYDRARKALADLLEADGRPADALDQLDQMVLADGFFDPADIDAQRTRLTAAQEAAVAK